MPRQYNNTIGEGIYNRIKDYDIISRKVFLNNLPAEHRELYNKYSAVIRKRNSLNNDGNRERAKESAREGMKKLRETRPKEQQKEQRKIYDTKYNEKRKLTKEQAVEIIQKQYRQNKAKQEATGIAGDILGDLIDKIPMEAKKKKNREAVARHRAKKKAEQ